MAKKSSKAATFDEPELESTDESSEHEGDQISKAEAARRTLAEGIELPRKATVYIKEKYGLDVTPQQFSAEKSRLKHRSGGALSGTGSERPTSRLSAYTAPATGGASGNDPGLLEALEAIKPLIDSLGAEKVHRMVDLLG